MNAFCICARRSLPLQLYQVSTKYRDEMKPKFGLIRSKEFLMKDLYTFDKDLASPTNCTFIVTETLQPKCNDQFFILSKRRPLMTSPLTCFYLAFESLSSIWFTIFKLSHRFSRSQSFLNSCCRSLFWCQNKVKHFEVLKKNNWKNYFRNLPPKHTKG